MAKEAKIGEMRTRIFIQRLEETTDADGFQVKAWVDLFGGKAAWCKWVNPHGRESDELMRLDLATTATLTMRYTPLLTERCRVFRAGDPRDDAHAYEVVSIDNVQERRKTMEVKARRVVKA